MSKNIEPAQLRLTAVTVKFNQGELLDLDRRRGYYPRSAFMRASAMSVVLIAAVPPEQMQGATRLADTYENVLKTRGNLTQLNQHLAELNQLRFASGPQAAAEALERRLNQVQLLLDGFALDLAAAAGGSR